MTLWISVFGSRQAIRTGFRQAFFSGILISALILALPAGADDAAATQPPAEINTLEQGLFGRDYSGQPMEDRLNRLESVIFGQAKTGDVNTRLQALENVYNNTHPAAPPPGSAAAGAQQAPREKDVTDYPAVTQLEQQTLHQTYPHEDVQKRLSRVEKAVYGQTYDELPMVDRVDQLTLKVFPKGALGQEEGVTSDLPNSGQEFKPTSLAVYSQLTTLEEQILGRTFGGDLITNRLNRLEKAVFGGPQKGSVDDRVSHLLQQYQYPQRSIGGAGGNAVGAPEAYTPNGNYNSSGVGAPEAYTPNPGNGLGGGRTMRGQSSAAGLNGGPGFSSDFMNMLPPGVRQQIMRQGAAGPAQATPFPQNDGTQNWAAENERDAQQAIPTPYMPQQPTGYPYQAPGNFNRMPYSAPNPYYAAPQPNGYPAPQQQAPPSYYVQPYNGSAIPGGGGMSTVPQVNSLDQSVTMLEVQVFGQPMTGSPLVVRLNNLEMQVFHQTYPTYPMAQRVNQLNQQMAYRQGMIPDNQQPLAQAIPVAPVAPAAPVVPAAAAGMQSVLGNMLSKSVPAATSATASGGLKSLLGNSIGNFANFNRNTVATPAPSAILSGLSGIVAPAGAQNTASQQQQVLQQQMTGAGW